MIVLDTPGSTPATLRHVRFKKLKCPYFPADTVVPGMEPGGSRLKLRLLERLGYLPDFLQDIHLTPIFSIF